ncbi:MAG: formate/nitrite transporter family protein [Treponemataceae bacterium]|nr:formate/nitrite transporter family protein [Treponemataceae bacterium]
MNSPGEIAEIYIMVGDGKTVRKSWVLFLLGIFGGAFIAFGALGSQIAMCASSSPAVGRCLSGLVFPIGLMMITIAGGELFTGNCLITISVLSKNTYLRSMLRSWLVVYLGNFVGGVAIAFLVNYGNVLNVFNGALLDKVLSTAVTKANMPFMEAFIKGVLCNFMVCIAVWCSFSTEDVIGKILSLYLPVALFVICGFEHSVANMYFIPAGLFAQMFNGGQAEGLTWANMMLNNLLPVTLGNIVGGSVLVGAGYWLIFLSSTDNE